MIYKIDKEIAKKKNIKIYIGLGIVGYIYIACVFFQCIALRRDNPRLSINEAVDKALSYVFIHPLNVFPISIGSIMELIFITILVVLLGILIYTSTKRPKHDNPETVNGEAHLMTAEELHQYNLKFSSPLRKEENDGFNNMIISKDIRLAIDNKGTRRNCNILVIGGSGAGKSRFFAAPNILQYNCNFVITDPSGELLHDYGKALEDNGYEVKVFNITDVYRSNRYNPFHYIKEEKDIFILVNTLIKNTTPSEGKAADPFWENSEKLLITALVAYLWHKMPPEEQTFDHVIRLLMAESVSEDETAATMVVSALEEMFNELKREEPTNLAVTQYTLFKKAAGKTIQGIIISVAVRLQAFVLDDIKYLTAKDDFQFERFADTKQAIFIVIPTSDTTFNFIVSLLYSQLFSSLYTYAETTAEYGWKICTDKYSIIKTLQAADAKSSKLAKKKCKKLVDKIVKEGVDVEYDEQKNIYKVYSKAKNKKNRVLLGWRGKEQINPFLESLKNLTVEPCDTKCPNHVRLILDEFANIGQIPDFDQKLATMRKYEISCSIILQALSQLKDIYKDKSNTIVANCDTKLFLGSDDTETIEWMLKMLGKRTTTVVNESYQNNINGSTSYNRSSIELLTIDQISMMQDDECLVRIRGVRPYYGKKYELTKHPNYQYAQKVADKFEIPLAKEAVNRKSGPLRLRLKQAEDKMKAAGASVEDNNIAKDIKDEERNPQVKKYDERKAKNAARKSVANEAKREAEEMDAEFSADAEGMIISSFLSTVGVSPSSSDEDIKESAESYIELLNPPSENISYKRTE